MKGRVGMVSAKNVSRKFRARAKSGQFGAGLMALCSLPEFPDDPKNDVCLTANVAPPADQRVDAPRTSTRESQIQKDEAQNDSQFAAIHDWEERARRVHREVCDRHFTTDDECDWSREQPDEEQQTAEELENPGDSGLREQRQRCHRSGPTAGWIVEQLLAAVLHVDQRSSDAQQTENEVGPSITSGYEQVHGSLGE
jgi:hypothetical protein